MKPEEKNQDRPGAETGDDKNSQSVCPVDTEQVSTGQPCALPDVEKEGGPSRGSVPETESDDQTGGASHPQGSRIKAILEALIFVSEQPLSIEKMASVLTDCPRKELRELLNELEQEYQERGGALEIVQVANAYQVRTRPEFTPWIGKLRQQRFARLSRAGLETLAIVAYRQPATRAEIEAIRGVDTGAVLGTLLERRLLRVLGRKEVPGRPILYGTTQEFLELFGLKNLKDLPTLREIEGMFDTTQAASAGSEEEGREDEETSEDSEPPQPEGERPVSTAKDGSDEPGDEQAELAEEEPVAEEEITPGELDAILKSTRIRLKHFEGDEQAGNQTGQPESAEGADENAKTGEGESPDEG